MPDFYPSPWIQLALLALMAVLGEKQVFRKLLRGMMRRKAKPR